MLDFEQKTELDFDRLPAIESCVDRYLAQGWERSSFLRIKRCGELGTAISVRERRLLEGSAIVQRLDVGGRR